MHFCGMGFHPDTLASEYVDCQNARPLFEPQFTELVIQPLLDDGLELLADRVYEIGMNEFSTALKSECGFNL